MESLHDDLVVALYRVRNRFGQDAASEKLRLLERCAARTLTSPRVVLKYHDVLLFLAAHPDSTQVRKQAGSELDRIADAVPRFRTGDSLLLSSGLPGTAVEAVFSLDLTERLADRFPDAVEVAWNDGSAGDAFDEFRGNLVLPAERDGLLAGLFTTQEWIDLASSGTSNIAWIIRRLRQTGCEPEILDRVFEGLDVFVRWRLDADSSRTFLRMPPSRVFHQRGPLKRSFSMPRLLARPLPEETPLAKRNAAELIDIASVTLAVRSRETDPVTHAHAADVAHYTLDRGIEIALFGTKPARRLPVESFIGYVAARNGIPAAYGGAWIIGHRAEIGVHLFDAFRGGESAYLFGQVVRTYGQRFDVHRFTVDPYQFGADNPDAIRSGAFWFYYRMGFRPADPKLDALAADEWTRISADRKYRTPPAILRKFTKSPLALDLPGHAGETHTPPLPLLSVAVTTEIHRRFGGDRVAAERWSLRRLARLLRPGRRSSWPAAEQRSYAQLAPLMALLPDLDMWPAGDRRALARTMRAKGRPREREYVQAVQRLPRLVASLQTLATAMPEARSTGR